MVIKEIALDQQENVFTRRAAKRLQNGGGGHLNPNRNCSEWDPLLEKWQRSNQESPKKMNLGPADFV